MASLPPWDNAGRVLGAEAAPRDAAILQGANTQDLLEFDQVKRVSFHPETQFVERTERRQQIICSLFPVDAPIADVLKY